MNWGLIGLQSIGLLGLRWLVASDVVPVAATAALVVALALLLVVAAAAAVGSLELWPSMLSLKKVVVNWIASKFEISNFAPLSSSSVPIFPGGWQPSALQSDPIIGSDI